MILRCTVGLLVLLVSVNCFNPDQLYNESGYEFVPEVYRMEDVDECSSLGYLYCETGVEISPIDSNNSVWKIIEKTIESDDYLPRNMLRRGLCLPKEIIANEQAANKLILQKVEDEYKNINMSAKVHHMDCNQEFSFTYFDLNLVLVSTVYLSFLILATYTDYKTKDKSKNHVLITSFSLLSNWEKFKRLPTSPDYQRLKSMQGLRCMIMLSIIVGHSLYSLMYSYIENFKEIERNIGSYPFQIFANMGMYQVQIFLLMSGWLLALQVLTIQDMFKKYTLTHAFLMYLNRFLRLFPVVGLMIAFHTSNIPMFVMQGSAFASKLVQRTKNCRTNWWKTILFVHNNEYASKMCESGTWYLGVDSQMYFICLFIMYYILKHKKSIISLIKLTVVLCVIYGCIIWSQNMAFFLRITPRQLQFGQAEQLWDFTVLYISTPSSASTFVIGIIFGWVYYKTRNVDYKLSPLWFPVWLLVFVGVPWSVLHFSMYKVYGVKAALIGAVIKPIFAIGVGLGVLGMAHNLGGPVKRFFEWKGFEYLANITFSLYIFHFDVVFPRSLKINKPVYLSYQLLFINWALDICTSVLIGFSIYMILELPCGNVIKLFMKKLMDKEKSKVKKEE